MLKNLIKVALDLDNAGFKMEADIVDVIIRRVASEINGSEVPDVSSSTMEPEDFESLILSLQSGENEDEDENLDEESVDEFIRRQQEAGRW